MIYDHYFEGRKPSEKQVIQCIKRGLSQGFSVFEIAWGENMVTLEKGRAGPNTWHGWGWIKSISGHELAEQFNREGA
jgi:hypothetical protein